MKKLLLLLFICSVTITATAQSDSSTRHARQLLVLMGSGKLALQVMNNMIATYKYTRPEIPTTFWDDFMKEVNADELIDLVVPVYVKYYTDEELLQLITFYNSPLGKKVISTLPLISQESYQIGTEWGRRIGEKMANRLKEKGYIKSI